MQTLRRSALVPGLLALAVLAAPACAWQEAEAPPAGTPRAQTPPAAAPQAQDREHGNLGEGGLALQGYDPVAYFPEGGGAPREGRAALAVEHRGARYRFATEEHRRRFLEDPARYEPAYGGWCAYAMADGEQVSIDPESFLLESAGEGAPPRLLLFYDSFFADTRARWLKRPAELRPKADAAWAKLIAPPPPPDKDEPNGEG